MTRYDVKNLIAWLRAQPQGAEYNWSSIDGCLLVQYCRARAKEHEKRTGKREMVENYTECPATWKELAMARPWTFGAAAARFALAEGG